MSKYPTTTILGTTIHAITKEQAAHEIVDYAISDKPAVYVTKPYVEFLDLAATHSGIQSILNKSFLTLPDSVALQWAALYLDGGKRSLSRLITTLATITTNPQQMAKIIPERFAGADFCWQMLEVAAAKQASIYLVGHPQNGSIAHTAKIIQNRFPEISILGTFDGFDVNTKEDELVTELQKLKPNLMLIAIGFPRQERLMARMAPQLASGLLIGEGGTFDYESFGGTLKRAPHWMRRSGLEWLWRLGLQPKRIVRQLAIPRFIWKVYRSK
ncbi:MAG: WecB/TagA/CpsF family glycosyltransferase [Candidatus Saccharibacteria bacterium]